MFEKNVLYIRVFDKHKHTTMSRYKIWEQQGFNYLTLTVVGWIDIFSRQRYRDIILESLCYCRDNKGLHVVGWVIMSNHLHLIVLPNLLI